MEDASTDRETLNAIANDSLALFRVNLFIIVIYASVISFVYQAGDEALLRSIGNSFFTVNGFVFWIGSMTFALYSYRVSRRTAMTGEYGNHGRLEDRFVILTYVTTAAIGSFIAVLSLVFGVLDGAGPGPADIWDPIGIVGFSILMVMVVEAILLVHEGIRQKWGPYRGMIPDWLP